MEKHSYVFHSDSSHGWLEVPIVELKELKIFDEISVYSYFHGENAYLEEDRDAFIFVNTVGRDNIDVINIDDGYSSYIRNFNRFNSYYER